MICNTLEYRNLGVAKVKYSMSAAFKKLFVVLFQRFNCPQNFY